MQQHVFEYVQVALGRQWPSFFFFFRGITFTHAQYINPLTPNWPYMTVEGRALCTTCDVINFNVTGHSW